jgi:16S rRNA (uracil1498-N3)-methyltransferase
VYRLVIEPTQQENGEITLTSAQQRYLCRVLRLKDGDRFVAMDGGGNVWVAQIVGEAARILEKLPESTELPINVSLISALPKGNGYEEIVRCCTELGTTAFLPIVSDRTLLNPSPNKLQRWQKIALEAAEQCERQIVPEIWEPMNFTRALEEAIAMQADCYIGVTRMKAQPLLTCLQNKPLNNLAIATGPEGGWTEAEVEAAIAAGFTPVSFGSRILRAITAPIVALSVVSAFVEQSLTRD